MFYRYKDYVPTIDESAFIADSAQVIGDVKVGALSSIWFNVVLRGDEGQIKIGDRTSIQENTVCHLYEGFPLTVGNEVTVGHSAIIHGCTIKDGALIGMGATVLDGAIIGENSIIGANSLIPAGKEIPPNSLVLGSPGKVIREISDKDHELLKLSIEGYVTNAKEYRQSTIFEKISRDDINIIK